MTSPSFADKHQRWAYEEQKQNVSLEMELAKEYRQSWDRGSKEDRNAVLAFIYDKRCKEGFDLIVTALYEDEDLASEAAAVASGLIYHDYDLGPNIKIALEQFGRKHPRWANISQFALELLDARQR